MDPLSPAGAAAAAFAPSDPGFEALPLDALLHSHGTLLARIKLCFGADRHAFEAELMPLVRGYAGFVHLLPATAGNYFRTPGGLLNLGLEVAFFSLQGTDAHIFSGRATISERRELEPRWRVATFIGGLCSELHRAVSHLIVTTPDGEEWPACLGQLSDWLARTRASRYFVRWRPQARESRGLGLFALPHVVPSTTMQWLGHGNSIVVPRLMASIAGVPTYQDANVLDEIVRRSLALVIDRNLRASTDRYGSPQFGAHLERYLVDALRRLAAGHSGWIANRDKSRVWLGPEGLFLVWPGAATDVLSLLATDQLAGIPKSPQTLLDLLLEAGAFVASDDGRQTWLIQPPESKAPIEAVRLASPAIVLAGVDPLPVPLTAPLIAGRKDPHAQEPSIVAPAPVSESAGGSPAASSVAPTAVDDGTPVAEAQASQQLSLLDAVDRPAPTSDAGLHPSAHPTPAVRSRIRLNAPLRLQPAVRHVLAEAIDALNEDGRESDVCVVPQGIFVRLSEFERRGVPPAIAIRALQDAKMLRLDRAGGPPTIAREIRGSTSFGLIVAAEHVVGLDPATCHSSAPTAADATPMPPPQGG